MGRNLLTLPPDDLRKIRGKDIAMVFQDPFACLHPMYRVGAQIAEAVTRARRRQRQGRLGPGRRAARPRRHPERAVARPRLPASVLGRDAPARDDRDGARPQPVDPDLRRADHRTRRHGAGADPRADRGGEARVQHRRDPRHARSRCRRRDRELRDGHVRRPHHGVRAGAADLRAAAASVRLGPARLDAERRAAALGARADRRLAALAPHPADRLPVPPSLPLPLRAVPDRAPAARRPPSRWPPPRPRPRTRTPTPAICPGRTSSAKAASARSPASETPHERERQPRPATTSSRSSI